MAATGVTKDRRPVTAHVHTSIMMCPKRNIQVLAVHVLVNSVQCITTPTISTFCMNNKEKFIKTLLPCCILGRTPFIKTNMCNKAGSYKEVKD